MMKILFTAIVLSTLISCNDKRPGHGAENEKTSPIPTAVAAVNDTIPFPVYMAFNEFEPYINFSNDTTYVLNFWATWCKPCVAEMPYFERLIQAYKDKPVKILLVSMDFPKDIEKKLIPFVQQRNLGPHVLALADMDYNAWIDKVSPEWDGAIPFTLIYNQKGRKTKIGELSGYDELEKMVEAAL